MKEQMLNLIRETIISKSGADLLVDSLSNNTLTNNQRSMICSWLAERLASEGFDANYEPTALGISLEAAIDEVNRPNLNRP